MDLGGVGAVDAAFDALEVGFEQLLKLVEDGSLHDLDDSRFVQFLQRFERFRNRHALVDHQAIGAADRRNLPEVLCQANLTRLLAGMLRISIGEAARRVRAAEAVAERMSMLGEPLGPVRPQLAAAQRDRGDQRRSRWTSSARALAEGGRCRVRPG